MTDNQLSRELVDVRRNTVSGMLDEPNNESPRHSESQPPSFKISWLVNISSGHLFEVSQCSVRKGRGKARDAHTATQRNTGADRNTYEHASARRHTHAYKNRNTKSTQERKQETPHTHTHTHKTHHTQACPRIRSYARPRARTRTHTHTHTHWQWWSHCSSPSTLLP